MSATRTLAMGCKPVAFPRARLSWGPGQVPPIRAMARGRVMGCGRSIDYSPKSVSSISKDGRLYTAPSLPSRAPSCFGGVFLYRPPAVHGPVPSPTVGKGGKLATQYQSTPSAQRRRRTASEYSVCVASFRVSILPPATHMALGANARERLSGCPSPGNNFQNIFAGDIRACGEVGLSAGIVPSPYRSCGATNAHISARLVVANALRQLRCNAPHRVQAFPRAQKSLPRREA